MNRYLQMYGLPNSRFRVTISALNIFTDRFAIGIIMKCINSRLIAIYLQWNLANYKHSESIMDGTHFHLMGVLIKIESSPHVLCWTGRRGVSSRVEGLSRRWKATMGIWNVNTWPRLFNRPRHIIAFIYCAQKYNLAELIFYTIQEIGRDWMECNLKIINYGIWKL